MTFLPIVERELRVATRKRSTYWLRVVVALVMIVIAGGFMLLSDFARQFPVNPGGILFSILTWLSFIAACLAGLFFTSDCLSEEKRDGTLGLLFLTDLRGYDVVLGKLMATSLRSFYGLLAVFPILGVTLLMGGVTGGQFWRTMLALANALFFSLAAGVFISSLSRDAHKAMNGTLLLLVLILGGLPLLDLWTAEARGLNWRPLLSLASPGVPFVVAGHSGQTDFWRCLAGSHGTAWAFLALAALWTPRVWQQKFAAARTGGRSYHFRYGNARRRAALRHRLLGKNPALWLACRERWQGFYLRLFLFALVALFALFLLGTAGQSTPFPRQIFLSIGQAILRVLLLVFYLWVASQASRLFIEAWRTGSLELLLCSPLTVREIVSGQWAALRQLFLVPVVVVLGMQLLLGIMQWPTYRTMTANMPAGFTFNQALQHLVSLAGGTLTALADLIAVGWVGMWMGLSSRKPTLAVLKTLLLVIVIPWFVLAFAQWFLRMMAMLSGWSFWIGTLASSVLWLAKDIGFSVWARDRLYSQFRNVAIRAFAPVTIARPPVHQQTSAPPLINASR